MLEVDGLVRRFGELVALDGLSFAVGAGRILGFVGANGAGKTTAMRIVMGVDEPDAGTVRWDGAPVDGRTRAHFGYMPEERGLYPKMPARRQLAYLARLRGVGRSEASSRAATWLERVGLGARATEPVEHLSQGNQQRVQLAAALVHDPTLLVLDEPFSGLDPVGVDVLSSILLERAAAGVPVVFSSHQLELVEELCDTVVIIDAGRLVASGTVEELRTRGRPVAYRVAVDGPIGWLDDLPGVEILRTDAEGVVVELVGATSDELLDAARRGGRVTHFARVLPRLSDLYREAVAGNRATAGSAPVMPAGGQP